MRNVSLLAALIIGIVASMLVLSSMYVVPEGKQAVVTQFRRPVHYETDAGLHWKLPLIQSVHLLEKRLLAWDGAPENMQTLDKKRIFIDVWARWRIADLETFFTAVRTEDRGQKLLDDLVDSAVRDVVAGENLIEVVRSSNDELVFESEELQEVVRSRGVAAEQVQTGRDAMERKMYQVASAELLERYGIELSGERVHIKRINYVESVKQTVYERMRSERLRIANLFESQGEEEKKRIEGVMQEELLQIEGETTEQTERIRGEADAEVIRLTAAAYSQAPEFYEFLRRLELFQTTLGGRTRLILSTDSDLFRMLKQIELPSGPASRSTGAAGAESVTQLPPLAESQHGQTTAVDATGSAGADARSAR